MRTALLIVDVQNDYFPGGRNELAGPIPAAEKARLLLDAFRERKMPVVHVRHESTRPGATFFLPGTPGAQIHDSVRPLDGEIIVTKNFPNSFRGTGLLQLLRDQGIERLVVCGMMTHMCIDTTVRAAFDHGFPTLVAGDACATKNLAYMDNVIPAEQVHLAFLSALNGTFARVDTTGQILKLIE
jgi:nicotinamidase-related amidase